MMAHWLRASGLCMPSALHSADCYYATCSLLQRARVRAVASMLLQFDLRCDVTSAATPVNVRFDMSLCRRLCVQPAGDDAEQLLPLLGVLLHGTWL